MRWVKVDGFTKNPSPRMGFQELTIALPVPNEKMDGLLKLLNEKCEVVIQKRKKARSLTANNYCWAVCDELAKVLKISKDDVYRQAVKQVGVYEPLSIRSEAYPRFVRNWEGKGTGWIVDKLMDDGVKTECNAYYGSSTYDSAEMARLIGWLVEEAQAQGLDVMTPKERALLIENWKKGTDGD